MLFWRCREWSPELIALAVRSGHAGSAAGFGLIGFGLFCGRMPISGLLTAARRHGLRARTVDLRNSGDTAGPREQVVGYGAFVFEER